MPLTKQQIIGAVKSAELTKISIDYIEEILEEFKDEEIVPKDKAEMTVAIIEAEAKMNAIMAKTIEELEINYQKNE